MRWENSIAYWIEANFSAGAAGSSRSCARDSHSDSRDLRDRSIAVSTRQKLGHRRADGSGAIVVEDYGRGLPRLLNEELYVGP